METTNTNAIPRSGRPLRDKPHRLEKLLTSILSHFQTGQLTLRMPSGRTHVVPGSSNSSDENQLHGVWNLQSYRGLRRILRSKSMGFAEGYISGDWTTPDLTRFLEVMAGNMDALEDRIANWRLARIFHRLQHLTRRNTKRGSRRNISYHYDLGNDFYSMWLDPTMTYSSGLFDEIHSDLESSQINKYKRLAESLDLQSHHRVLEIGCGWGGFAEYAATNYGCQITCITLSTKQLDYAKSRIASAGLDEKVELRLQDYRDVTETYDRIVSIEMFEAVGEENWPTYFGKMRDCLSENGLAALQIINIADERFEDYRRGADFIQKYIFPGGMLPSPKVLRATISAAGLFLQSATTFGDSYARTLRMWREEFLANWDAIENLGYSKKFKRMWEYYLCYCEAGFRLGTIDVGHYTLAKRAWR